MAVEKGISMSILSRRLFDSVAKDCRSAYKLAIRLVDCDGRVILPETGASREDLPFVTVAVLLISYLNVRIHPATACCAIDLQPLFRR